LGSLCYMRRSCVYARPVCGNCISSGESISPGHKFSGFCVCVSLLVSPDKRKGVTKHDGRSTGSRGPCFQSLQVGVTGSSAGSRDEGELVPRLPHPRPGGCTQGSSTRLKLLPAPKPRGAWGAWTGYSRTLQEGRGPAGGNCIRSRDSFA